MNHSPRSFVSPSIHGAAASHSQSLVPTKPIRRGRIIVPLLLLAQSAAAAFTNLTTMPTAFPSNPSSPTPQNLGASVAVSGDTMVVGVLRESGSAPGVNGAPDNLMRYAGAAFVFIRDGTNWVQQAYLKASNPFTNDFFGQSVAISGDTIVVGAVGEDSNATVINGNQSDNSATNAGAAYVFVRSGTNWSQQAYLKASNTDGGDLFGQAVAISGDTIVVGAYGEDSNTTGVNGNQANNSLVSAGAAYVYMRSGSTWSQQAYLKASNTKTLQAFGYSVGLSSNTIVVGAYGENSSASGVNGNQADESYYQSGAAYVFVRSGSTWSQQAYLKASNPWPGNFFGWAVAVSGDSILCGANGESSNSTGVNGNQADHSAIGAGAAYVFVRTGGTWSQQAYLKASNTDANDSFASAVAIHGDQLVIGAFGENSTATGVNGNQGNTGGEVGAAYVFARVGTNWAQTFYLKPYLSAAVEFGSRVALNDTVVIVGAKSSDEVHPFQDTTPPPPPPPIGPSEIVSIQVAPTEIILECTGDPDGYYQLLKSSDPASGWGMIDAQLALPDGTFSFTDFDVWPDGAFYKLEQVSP